MKNNITKGKLLNISTKLLNNLDEDLIELLDYFNSYNIPSTQITFPINTNKIPQNPGNNVVLIRQSDFNTGTLRILYPGYYKLSEDILFNPNPENDWQPNANDPRYSVLHHNGRPCGGYILGFFTAITVEANNVIIDLNGHTIQQSKIHNIQQRFFSIIETASAPFISNQGPGCFVHNDDPTIDPTMFKTANKLCIINGTLGLSSHHSIHGNSSTNIILHNINFEDYEVAAVSLNGAENILINDCNAKGHKKFIPLLGTYSQARFIKQFLKAIPQNIDVNLNLTNGILNGNSILTTLSSELDNVKDYLMTGPGSDPTTYNSNTFPVYLSPFAEKGLDGNIYGFVFNSKGVVVNDFKTKRGHGDIGNINIVINNTNIIDVISNPKEVEIISHSTTIDKAQTGPAGDVFRILEAINDNDNYSGNSLLNAWIYLGKLKNQLLLSSNSSDLEIANGLLFHVSIQNNLVNWAENQTTLAYLNSKTTRVLNKDSMAHIMKGNIGLFIQSGQCCKIIDCNICNVKVNGNLFNTSGTLQGSQSVGLGIVASDSIDIIDTRIKKIISDVPNSNSYTILQKNNNNINIINHQDNLWKFSRLAQVVTTVPATYRLTWKKTWNNIIRA